MHRTMDLPTFGDDGLAELTLSRQMHLPRASIGPSLVRGAARSILLSTSTLLVELPLKPPRKSAAVPVEPSCHAENESGLSSKCPYEREDARVLVVPRRTNRPELPTELHLPAGPGAIGEGHVRQRLAIGLRASAGHKLTAEAFARAQHFSVDALPGGRLQVPARTPSRSKANVVDRTLTMIPHRVVPATLFELDELTCHHNQPCLRSSPGFFIAPSHADLMAQKQPRENNRDERRNRRRKAAPALHPVGNARGVGRSHHARVEEAFEGLAPPLEYTASHGALGGA